MSRSTWHYRTHPRAGIAGPIPQKDRAYRSRIEKAERAVIEGKITTGWAAGHSVDHTFAATWDQGVMLASRRSWWRVAADIIDQSARPVVPTRRGSSTPRAAPVLVATGPNQVWSWDITDLRSPWRGVAFKAYSIIDIYSRKLVGCRVEDREVDALAVEMFETAFAEHGTPQFVHADSGPAMRSTLLKDHLHGLGVAQTHNRPRVSNDNPFSESEFRTMKYRPNYPGTFQTIEEARAYICVLHALVQPEPQALRDRTVLTGSGPRRELAHPLAAARHRPTGLLRRAPRTVPQPADHTRAGRHRRHQPTQENEH